MTSKITVQAVLPNGERSDRCTYRGMVGSPGAAARIIAETGNPGWKSREVRHLSDGTYEVHMERKRKEATP